MERTTPPLFTTCSADGVPIIELAALRVAQEALDDLPSVASSWSSFPEWAQEAIKKVINEVYKVHLNQVSSLVKAVESLKTHRSNGTFPQVVIGAIPGVKSFHTDKILSDESRDSFSTSIETITHEARVSFLNTIIESKTKALELHRLRAQTAYCLALCRDRMFESLVGIGFTMETVSSSEMNIVIRALCHMKHNMIELVRSVAWSKLQAERKKASVASAASSVMDISSDLSTSQMTESIEKLVKKAVSSQVNSITKTLKSLSVSKTAPRPRSGSGSGSGSRSSGSRASGSSTKRPSSLGKGSRPSSSGSHKGRVQKGAPSPRRLAPAPTPFKQLKGKRG